MSDDPRCQDHEKRIRDMERITASFESKIDALDQLVAKMQGLTETLDINNKELEKRIYQDNGNPSLSSRVRDLESVYARHVAEHKKSEAKMDRWLFWIITTIGAMIVSGAGAVAWKVVQIAAGSP